MSKATIKAAIDANIKTNGTQAITGAKLNTILKGMVDDYGEQSGLDAAASDIDKLINGGALTASVAKTSSVKGRISGRTSSGRIIYGPSNTESVKVVFFPVTPGESYSVHIPRTGNAYTKTMGYTSTPLTSDATPDLSAPGTCLDTVGTSSEFDDTFAAENYPYVVFTYDSAYGDVELTHSMTIRGIVSDEADIRELQNGGWPGSARFESVLGEDGLRVSAATLTDGQSIECPAFPRSNKCGNSYSLSCKVSTFDKVIIAQGYDTYRCVYFIIDSTNVSVWFKQSDGSAAVQKAIAAHGLTISTILQVNIKHGDNGKYKVGIDSLGGSFSTELDWSGYDANGLLQVISDGSSLSSVKFAATNRNFSRPLWIFGASYEGIGDPARWIKHVKDLGYFGYLVNGYAGRGPHNTYDELVRAMEFGCPKFLYWTMFGNGTVSEYSTYTQMVKELCDENGVELILIYRPNSPAVASKYSDLSEAIDGFIDDGVRCVDCRNALSSDPSSSSGWYSGFLADDDTHPTTLGAKALAYAVLADLPEIMNY